MEDKLRDRQPGSPEVYATNLRPGDDSQRMARLMRRAGDLGLSRETSAAVREALMARLGVSEKSIDDPKRAAPSDKPAATPLINAIHALNDLLKQKVNSGARWCDFSAIAWQRLEKQPDVGTAASVVELAFLHGSAEEAGEALDRVRRIGADFYTDIHVGVREKLSVTLWNSRYKGTVSDLLLRERKNPALRPIEKRMVFRIMAELNDPGPSYAYFCANQEQILDSNHGAVPQKLSVDATRLCAARISMDLGHDELAKSLLIEIPEDSPCRDEALQQLETLSHQRKSESSGASQAALDIVRAESDWRDRLNLLHGFLLQARDSMQQPDARLHSVNELLRSSLALVPKEDGPWRQLSSLLIAFRDLEPVLPNLFEAFRQNAAVFHEAVLDSALWVAFLNSEDTSIAIDQAYWIGIAKVHQYVAQGPKYESCLRQARDLVERASAEWDRPVPVKWRDLLQSVSQACATAPHLFDYDRQIMLRQCRVAHERELIVIADIEEYLNVNEHPSIDILSDLIEVCRKRQADSLEFRLIVLRAQTSHLVNQDLVSCWRMAVAGKSWDEAWRAATILNARGALTDQARYAWDMSGEKRSRYTFNVPTSEHLRACYSGLSAPVASLIRGCLSIGPRLPELFAIKYPNVRAVNQFIASLKNPDTEVDRALDSIPWMPSRERGYVFSYELDSAPGSHLPAFIHVLPENIWSQVVLKICDRMSMHVWGWKVSTLHKAITEMVPRGTPAIATQKQSAKVARWMRDLTREQRSSWQKIVETSRILDDSEAQLGIALFVCRLATVICQSHFEALKSLQQMRAPVSVIWDLESWIMSDDYTRIRRSMGTTSRVPVPATLQKIDQAPRSFLS